MRLVCLCVLAMDAVLSAESVELLANVLATLVVTQSEQLLVSLGLSVCLELLKRCKRVAFRLEQDHSTQA